MVFLHAMLGLVGKNSFFWGGGGGGGGGGGWGWQNRKRSICLIPVEVLMFMKKQCDTFVALYSSQ